MSKSDSKSDDFSIPGVFGGSMSNLTTDDVIRHLAAKNIQSEIKGDKFVPKKMDLKRLNINDLSRKDLLRSKRVRVQQVVIGGALQVGVAETSIREDAEDENRHLRKLLIEVRDTLRQPNRTIVRRLVIQLRRPTINVLSLSAALRASI